jgi:hypothetical protein
LKSLCRVLNAKDPSLDCYVIGNNVRPLLSYGPKNSRTLRRTFMYVEALQKFEADTKNLDLTEAYKKARPAFTGKLERNFLLLKDNPGEEDMDMEPATGANAEPLSK